MRAIDFGVSGKQRIQGANGPIPLPKTRRGLDDAQKFAEIVRILLDGEDDLFDGFPGDDLVMESTTIGSSGADPELIWAIVAASEHNIYFIPSRAYKNFKRRHGLKGDDVTERQKRIHLRDVLRGKGVVIEDNADDDDLAAACIYYLATDNPDRLKLAQPIEKFDRKHTTVRPWDKRKYKGTEPDRLMALLPAYWDLPADMQQVFGDGKNYSRARTMPFAQALTEDIADTRAGYEKVIGLYGHGYPSHYRRAVEDLRQHIAKKILFHVSKIDEVSEDQHKESRRVTRLYIRRLYHLAQGIPYPVKGNPYPAPS